MKTFWVKPRGLQVPRPGTTVPVQLQQNVDRRPLHTVGTATVYRGGATCVQVTESSEAGRVAAELLREDCLDAVFWGSKPTLRLR